ncbi:MAG: hypothetical protein GWP91_09455 [Rhodobacterales bacterium]|nr:hypothetical protein [Rhodobacterales bacterium]
MRLFSTALLTGLLSTGCNESWYGYADAELALDIEGFALVDARVVTPPEAWPRDLYGNALRVGMDDEVVIFVGEVVDGVVLDEPRDVNDSWGDNVNLLDAWRDCRPNTDCDLTFRFEVSCAGGEICEGRFSGDAFLSEERRPLQRERSGAPIALSFTEVGPRGSAGD